MRARGATAVLVGAALVLGFAQLALWAPGWSATPVVAEGLRQRAAKPSEDRAAEWMADHARDGMILIDDSVNPVLPVIDADLDRVAAPFSGRRWTRTLRDPDRAEWLYVDTERPAGPGRAGDSARPDVRRRLRPALPERHLRGLPAPTVRAHEGRRLHRAPGSATRSSPAVPSPASSSPERCNGATRRARGWARSCRPSSACRAATSSRRLRRRGACRSST